MPPYSVAAALGERVIAGRLPARDVEGALFGAAERCGLVADDGAAAAWRTIRSGLAAAARG